MDRRALPARPLWEQRLREVGFNWYAPTADHPVPYWSEEAYYSFTASEIRSIEQDAQRLVDLIFEATDYAIRRERMTELGIPEFMHGAIRASWERDDPTLYMRLDLAYDGTGPAKLLEVNAQTPTSLLEAAICQWQWLEDHKELGHLPKQADQWNGIHEALLSQWSFISEQRKVSHVHFSSAEVDEDLVTVTYLQDLAQQAGVRTAFLFADDIGTHPESSYLLDQASLPIAHLMWLWPFEYAWESRDARFLSTTQTRFIEPLWKAVASSKGLLAILSDLNPGHASLLPATFRPGSLGQQVVRKPVYSREGQNVELPGQMSTPGAYGDLPVIEQRYTELPTFYGDDGPRYPVLGVWVAGDELCGLGLREGRQRVTDNRATFVPHVISG